MKFVNGISCGLDLKQAKEKCSIWQVKLSKSSSYGSKHGLYDKSDKMSKRSPWKYRRMYGNWRKACAAGMPRRNPRVTDPPVAEVLDLAWR